MFPECIRLLPQSEASPTRGERGTFKLSIAIVYVQCLKWRYLYLQKFFSCVSSSLHNLRRQYVKLSDMFILFLQIIILPRPGEIATGPS